MSWKTSRSTRTIEIDEFVPKADIDSRYLIRPYYLVPDGKVGHDAFAVIRETIRSMNKVARAGRAHKRRAYHRPWAAQEWPDGHLAATLRGIQDVKVTKDMLDLAKHIVNQKSATFNPEKFEDH
jgi:DNA end-binding protein Ku